MAARYNDCLHGGCGRNAVCQIRSEYGAQVVDILYGADAGYRVRASTGIHYEPEGDFRLSRACIPVFARYPCRLFFLFGVEGIHAVYQDSGDLGTLKQDGAVIRYTALKKIGEDNGG